MKMQVNWSFIWKTVLCLSIIGIGLLGVQVQPSYAHRPHDVIEQVVLSPDYGKDQNLMIIVRGNLYKSNDGGQNWRRVVQGLDKLYQSPTPITDLALTPSQKDHFFAATAWNGIYKSEDGGESWFSVNEGLPTSVYNNLSSIQIQRLAVSPNSEKDVLASGTEGGLYLTQNGGQKWQSILDSSQKINAVVFTPKSKILAADAQGNLLRSDDLGKTWQKLATLSSGNNVNRIAVSPNFSQDNTFFLATAKEGILKTTDGGKRFIPMMQGVKDKAVQDVSLSPNYAENQTLALVNWHEGAFLSQDGGQTWTKMSQGLTKDRQADEFKVPHFYSVRFSPNVQEDKTLFVGGFNGLFHTNDLGKTWHELETLSLGTVMALGISPDYAQDQTLAIATYVGNIYRSQNQGKTWQPINKGLERPLFENRFNRDPQTQDPRRFYDLEFSPNYAQDQTFWVSLLWNQIVKTVNQGNSWQIVDLPAPKGRGSTLAVSPNFSQDQTLFVITQEGRVYRSTDGGNRFRKVGNIGHTTGNDPSSIVISPNFAEDKTLYAVAKGGVFQSQDSGVTWTSVSKNTVTEQLLSMQLAISPNYAQDKTILLSSSSGLFLSEEGGETWRELEVIPVNSDPDLTGVAISPDYAKDQTIVATVRGKGLYKSTDSGQTFSNVGDNALPITKVENIPYAGIPIQFSPNYAQDKTLFGIGSAKTQVYRSMDGGDTWEVLTVPVNDHNHYSFLTQLRVRALVYRRHLTAIALAILAAVLSYLLSGYFRLDKRLPLSKMQMQVLSGFVIFLVAFFAVEQLL